MNSTPRLPAPTHRTAPACPRARPGAALLLCAALWLAAPAHGASFTVTTEADETTANGLCSLREAIGNANANAQPHADCPAGQGSQDSIGFAPSVGRIVLTSGNLVLGNGSGNAGALLIDGSRAGLADVEIDGSGNGAGDWHIFLAGTSPSAHSESTLRHLRISRGQGIVGAALYLYGNAQVTLADCAFEHHRVIGNGAAVENNGQLRIERCRFADNRADGHGGAIVNLNQMQIADSLFADNRSANRGGAIYSQGGVQIEHSTFEHNDARNYGGAIYAAGGALDVSRSTFSRNFVGHDGQSPNNSGGAIHTNAPTTLVQSTFSGNAASVGGAIYGGNTTMTLVHSTLAINTGPELYLYNASTTLLGSVLAGGIAVQRSGGTLNARHSLFASGLDAVNGIDEGNLAAPAALDYLRDNGGAARTHAPLPGSAAIDAVDCDAFAGYDLAADQRGTPRPQGARCDLGSVEAWVHRLHLTVAGAGYVSDSAGRIGSCSGSCEAAYPAGTIQLTASPAARFTGWSGACAGTDPVVSVAMDQSRACTAQFASVPAFAVAASVSPALVADVACTPDPVFQGDAARCSVSNVHPDHVFTGWSGDCSGTGGCVLDAVDGERSVVANFAAASPPAPTLLVTTPADTVAGDGECSLREAIANANANAQPHADCAPGGSGEDRIGFAAGVASITLGTAHAEPTLVLGNAAGDAGPLVIDGRRPNLPDVVIDGGNAVRVFLLGVSASAFAEAELSHLRIQRGRAAAGAGLFVQAGATARLSGCAFANNEAVTNGGAVVNDGELHVERCHFASNLAGNVSGGAIYSTGPLEIWRSSFTANRAASLYQTFGGAIYTGADTTIGHSTFSGNQGSLGGSLYATALNYWDPLRLLLLHNTFHANSGPELYLQNTATELLGNALTGQYIIQASGTIGARYNLTGVRIERLNGVDEGNIVAPAQIGALADNGGGMPSHAPLTGSPLIDAVPCDAFAGYDSATDQRGLERPKGARCDIGAVEVALYTLDLTVNGSGYVSDSAGLIDACNGACQASYPGAPIELTATPAARFTGWSGDCSGTDPVVALDMAGNRYCTANFTSVPAHPIAASAQPAVASVACEPNPVYQGDSAVCAYAEPQAGYYFTGWSGDCGGTGPCVLDEVDGERSVVANFAPLPAQGELLVTTEADTLAHDGACSLREAVGNAIANAQPHPDCAPGTESGTDTIRFAANVQTIVLGAGQLALGRDDGLAGALAIDGRRDGLPDVTLDGDAASRVLLAGDAAGGEIAIDLRHLRIRNGRDVAGGGLYVYSNASVRLSDCALLDNTATASGGAIENNGELRAERCAFAGNLAQNGGGALYNLGQATIAHSTLAANGASQGAAIFQPYGELTLLHSTLGAAAGSTVQQGGGQVRVLGSIVAGADACRRSGGTLAAHRSLFETGADCIDGQNQETVTGDPRLGALQDNGGATLTQLPGGASVAIDAVDCDAFAAEPGFDNGLDQRGTARPQGGRCDLGAVERTVLLVTTEADALADDGFCSLREAIDNANRNDQGHADCGPGSTAEDAIRFAPQVSRVVLAGGQLILGNEAGNSGPLTIAGQREGLPDVEIDGNGASRVLLAGASAGAASIVRLERLRIAGGNDAAGAGLYVYANADVWLSHCVLAGHASANVGGAIENNGELYISDCTISGNRVTNLLTGQGGAVFNAATGTMRIERSTLSGNSAPNGAAILNSGDLALEQSTVSGNTPSTLGSNIRADGGQFASTHSTLSAASGVTLNSVAGTTTLRASIVAGPNACVRASGTVHARYSLFQNGVNCANGDNADNLQADPRLDSLDDNGGATRTHLPLPDSGAIDAVPCDAFAGFDNRSDQRGVARPSGLRCDIGSTEFEFVAEFLVQSLDGAATGTCTPDAGNPLLKNCTHLYRAVAEANQWPGHSRVRFRDDLSGTVEVAQTLDVGTGGLREWRGPLDENGRPRVSLSGGSLRRVLVVAANADFLLDGLAVVDGYDPATAGAMYVHPGARVRAHRCRFSGNVADLKGGAIESNGSLHVVDCDFTDNLAGEGAWWDELSGGGAILANQGELRVEHGRFSGNRGVRGGAVYNYRSPAEFFHSRFENNQTGPVNRYPGGAINHNSLPSQPLRIEDSVFEGNIGALGGAVRCTNSPVTILRSRFAGNLAGGGGALYLRDGTIGHSLFDGNQAENEGGAILAGEGTLHVLHSTLSGNSAATRAGAIRGDSSVVLVHSTVAGNSAANTGGVSGSVRYVASVLAGNAGGDCSGTVLSQHSLIEDPTCALAGGSVGHLDGDPLLGSLQDNGGGTLTHLPGAGSPLLEAVACDFATEFDTGTDQRGIARPQGLRCDIGAAERELFALGVSVLGAQGSVSATSPTPLSGAIAACSAVGGDCEAGYEPGATVALAATPAPGWNFAGWGGDCAGSLPESSVAMTQNRACTASFVQYAHVISASADPAAGGSVACTPNPVEPGQDSTCTYTTHPGWYFTGWSGACTGDGACVLEDVDGPRTVVAHFAAQTPLALSVAIDNGRELSQPGQAAVYRIVVANASGNAGNGILLTTATDPEGALLLPAWECDAASAAYCTPVLADGHVAVTLDLPAHAEAAIDLAAEVGEFGQQLDAIAALGVPIHYSDDAGDNLAIDTDRRAVLFRDGFEDAAP